MSRVPLVCLVLPIAFILISTVCPAHLLAQSNEVGLVSVTFTDKSIASPRTLCLNCFSNGHFQLMDSTTISEPKRSVSLRFESFTGSCELNFLGRKDPGAEFIANPSESIQIETDFAGIKNGSIAIENSTENLLYAQLQSVRSNYSTHLNGLLKLRDRLSSFQSNYLAEIQRLDFMIEQVKDSINQACDNLMKGNEQLFVSRVTKNLVKLPTRLDHKRGNKYDTHVAFLHEHYFDFIDFDDPETFNHYALTFLFEQYFAKYSSTKDHDLYNSCDVLMKKSSTNPTARDYMYNFLIDYGISRNMEYLTEYMQENYGNECELNLNTSQASILKAQNNVQVGKVTPDILMYDASGNPQSLKQFVKQHDHTILLFWISWCVRCHKELPRITAMRSTMEKHGVGLFTVGLDENEGVWKAELDRYRLPGVHVSEQVPLEQSKALRDFGIRTTPTLFVLDSNGQIVSKNIFGNELENLLKTLKP